MQNLEQVLLALASKHGPRGVLVDTSQRRWASVGAWTYVAAVSSGGDAINFTHMRDAAGTV